MDRDEEEARDAALARAPRAGASGASLPMRVLDEYEFRDKFEGARAVYAHACKPQMVLVVGKARKLEGDGEGGTPSEVLARPLTPRDAPAHALKLMDVNDWTIKYGGDAPELWLVTPRAWYKLLDPSPRFEKYLTVTLRRANFTNALVKALMKDWNMGLDEGLEKILSVPVVKHDMPMAIKTPTKAARLLGDTTAEAQKEAALNGLDEEEAKETASYSYTHADIVGDGFFIVSQLEALIKAKSLRSSTPSNGEEEMPTLLTELQNWTSEKLQLGSSSKAAKLERDRAKRERLRAERLAEKELENEPREPRLEPPPPASQILPEEYNHIGPALQTEVLTLWDFSQVFSRVLHCPLCPLERFAKAFLGTEPGAAEAALLRDFMVACLRMIEGRIDSIDHENSRIEVLHARWWDAPVIGLIDVGELDWQDRASNFILEFQRHINARMRKPALEAIRKLDAGEAVERLDSTLRVALAVALSNAAIESESMRIYYTEVFEDTRERRKTGKFHMMPPTLATEVPEAVKVKEAGEAGEKDDALSVDADVEMDDGDVEEGPKRQMSLTEHRREQLMQFRREAVERTVLSRGKPVAVDEQGRRYFTLGGANNAGRLFVETAPLGWHKESQNHDDEAPTQPMAGPPVEELPYTKDASDVPMDSGNVTGLVEYASRWGVYKPGPEFDALSAWCNPCYDNERFITKLHRLISHAIEGVEDDNEELDEKVRIQRLESLCASMSTDGYANLDDVSLDSLSDRVMISKLFNAVKFVLHSCPFWRTGDNRWIDRFLKVSAHLDGLINAPEQSLTELCKILPGVESVCAQASLMVEPAWSEVKPTWLAQLRFYVFGRRTEAELAGAAPTSETHENIPGINDIATAPELLEPLAPLTVRRAANLVNQFVRYLVQDPMRMSQASFQAFTGIAHGVAALNTGDVVALIRRGLSKTFARYVDKKLRPRNWIDINTLRPVERCMVLGTAYRGTEAAPQDSTDAEDRPPCAWLMLLLLDGPEMSQFPSTRRKSAEGTEEKKDDRRIVVAPVVPGGDIADYVLSWRKFREGDEKPWKIGDRIVMQFEGVDAEDEKRGIIAIDGVFYYLGRVRKTRSSPDSWETIMVVFDSDPEDNMWVSPWEIVEAPEIYRDPAHALPDAVDFERPLSAEDIAYISKSKAVARRLGWPKGESRAEFDELRQKAYGAEVPRAPIFCGVQMNLHRVFIEAMHIGGYEHVTRLKHWKSVARTLGRDLTSQTSASFAMRRSYEKCLFALEKYVMGDEISEKLGIVVGDDESAAQLPGMIPNVGSDDEFDEPRDDDEMNEEEEEEEEDEAMDVDEKETKRAAEGGDDYKMSDDDFDEDANSDDGESDSDFAPRRKVKR